MGVVTRRIYEPAVPAEGYRVLVERLWPRGFSRGRAHVDLWLKDAGASTELRKWFGHDPMKWDEFRLRYFDEIRGRPDVVDTLRNVTRDHEVVTFLFSAHDEDHNNAATLFQSQLMPTDPYLRAPLATLDGRPCWGYAWEREEEGGRGEMILAPATRPDIKKVKRIRERIIGGGYSADEPEGPSALVHFYDPMASEGKRYLTDQQAVVHFLKYMNTSLNSNPETDARDWGLKDLSRDMEIYGINFIQEYAYDDAKENLLKALASHENNNEYYGRAWRGVG